MNTKIRALILFNERVDRLTRSDLAIQMENPKYKLDYERIMQREWISINGVTEDAVDAFVLNVRLLIQNQDGFSIRSLANDVYTDSSVPSNLKDRYDTQRVKWREHIEQSSMFKHFTEDRNFTNGELFDIIMYGGLVHANRDKVDLFWALTKQGAFSSFVCGSFLSSLRFFLGVVRNLQNVNSDLLNHWGC